MAVLDLSAYKPAPATLGDANQIANGFQAIQACINALDNNNFAAGKIFDPLKLMQDGAVQGQGLVWNGTSWVPQGAMTLIASATPNAATVQFSSIPNTFKHLKILWLAANTSGVDVNLSMTFNGDVAANYAFAFHETLAGATNQGVPGGQTAVAMGATSSSAAGWAAGEINIPGYTTAANKRAVATYYAFGGNNRTGVYGGAWAATNVINQINLAAGNFVNGSRFDLYGCS